MKIPIHRYQFDASAKTITFPDYKSVDQSNFLLITNTTDNVIIYNFAVPAKGGTVSSNVLTLTFDTTTMSDSDDLEIYYEDPGLMAATREEQYVIQEFLATQLIVLQQLTALTNAINGASLNVIAGTGSTTVVSSLPTLANVTTVGTVTTVTGVTSVTNLAQIGAVNAAEFVFNQSQQTAALTNYANIYYS